jgi:3-hydroxyacyl-CoA dehydrogenase / enoyl-CoA hydratase / 3-hydroxybutyryl-CoA epimerase
MINYQIDDAGIVTLCIDMPSQAVNTMNQAFQQAFAAIVTRLEQEKEHIKGVLLTSAKSTFFAGGDLNELLAIQPKDAAACRAMLEANHRAMRRLELLGKPVVALIHGSALGGGLELTLACHYRIALDVTNAPKLELGFPEVTLGLLPGAGGVIRTVRMLGLQAAMPFLTEGQRMTAQQALQHGFIHAIAPDLASMQAQARAWILANPAPRQPWDQSDFRIPGGDMRSAKIVQMAMVAPAMLREKTRGNYPAPEAILSTMVEGVQVDIDTALLIESRYFTELATGQVAKNMISTFFFQMQEMQSGKSRPSEFAKTKVQQVGVVGAGMMGAGIAWANASRGIRCVLHDVTLEKAEQGKAYSAKLLQKRQQRGKTSAEQAAATLDLIQPSADFSNFAGCELVIEAVFEKRALKAEVTQALLPHLGPEVLMCSNTSTLPITGLAQAFPDPERFIGLHFFSPVDKMKLVEIIKGKQTSAHSLARAYDYVLQLGKYPIVVNDSRGFFTSRVFGCFVNEGMALLQEGVPAAMIENAALSVGMPVGPLAVQDEVSLSLAFAVHQQTALDLAAAGQTYQPHSAVAVLDTMLNQCQRAGKAAGAGFYDYPAGAKKQLWPGLAELFGKAADTSRTEVPFQDVCDRLLYIQAIETLRCLNEGVLESARDANIGSIFGFGFPAWTGGARQFIEHLGHAAFTERANTLQTRYGARFSMPELA